METPSANQHISALQAGRMSDLVNTAQRKQDYTDPDCNPSKDGGSEKDSDLHPGPAGSPVWTGPPPNVSLPGVVPHLYHHSVQPGMVDPLSLRFHSPCQSLQCELTYPAYFVEPQSGHLLTGPVPAPPDGSHHSSVSAPWFTHEPILCSMMLGDFNAPAGSISVQQAMEHQQFHERLTEFTPHLPQPVLCNVSGGGQVNPCEPEPVFLTLTSAPQHGEDDSTQGKGVSVLGTPSQPPQYRQACPLYESRDQTANMQPQGPPAQTVGIFCDSKSRKRCHCTRSKCLKLYCECFASGVMCSNCDCSNCHNNAEHEMERHEALKIAGGRSGEVKDRRNKGCNCKCSGCLKNYCVCYEANIKCTSKCKCVGCRNYDDSSEMGPKEKSVNVTNKLPGSVITSGVVEAVCSCLLVKAEMAERDAQSPVQAEHMVLEEFGHCVSQIVEAMFENNTD